MRKILSLLLLAACHSEVATPAPKPFAVRVAKAVEKTVPIFIEALGHVDPLVSIQIKSRIEGEIIGIHFDQGQVVEKNSLLFTIDPAPYEAALKQAESALNQSLANQVLALEKVKRYRQLAKDEYYSQIDYETLQVNLAANTALVEQNKAAMDAARINLDYCTISAPITGLAGILQVDFGNLVGDDNDKLVSLNQISPIYVTYSVPEFQLKRILNAEKPCTVKAAYETFSDQIFEGTLTILDNEINNDTGMIRLRALFDNENQKLWPGQFIRTRTILSTLENAIVVPDTAVQYTQGGPTIFVLNEDSTVEQRKVTLGPRMDGEIVIQKNLKAGETVVTEGQLNLMTGSTVAVKS